MTDLAADSVRKEADPLGKAEPQMKTPPGREERKRSNITNLIITLVLLLLVVWQLGLFDTARSFINLNLMSPQPKPLPTNFIILVPDIGSTLNPAAGEATLRFINSANSEVKITGIEVEKIGGNKCLLTTKLPLTVASGEKFSVTAAGCGQMGEKRMTRITVNISAVTSLKSKALAESSSTGPLPINGLSKNQQIEFKKNLVNQLDRLNNSDKPVKFESSGTLTVS
ncbi:MAG: hypothetical protein V1875_07845 [Candidatus Altiarchaeota archaeon]